MSLTADHSGSLSLADLQKSLWLTEAGMRKVSKIEVVGTMTRSTHDTPRVPRRSLILVEDNAAGNIPAPDGAQPEPVCRGEALIEGAKKKVAAFRKKPA